MAKEKHNKVLEILHRIANRAVFTPKDLDSVVGRLQWATSTCPLAKPLLQPLCQWKGAVKSSAPPTPKVIALYTGKSMRRWQANWTPTKTKDDIGNIGMWPDFHALNCPLIALEYAS